MALVAWKPHVPNGLGQGCALPRRLYRPTSPVIYTSPVGLASAGSPDSMNTPNAALVSKGHSSHVRLYTLYYSFVARYSVFSLLCQSFYGPELTADQLIKHRSLRSYSSSSTYTWPGARCFTKL
jgi:hypothetical protein